MKILAWRKAEDGRWDADEREGDLGGAARVEVGGEILTTPGNMPVEATGLVGIVPGRGDMRTGGAGTKTPKKLDPAAYEELHRRAVMEAHARRPAPLGEPAQRAVRP